MLVIVKICKKWRHYIKDVKYFIRMMINHVNFKNFFINKILNRKETRWWKKLTELDLKIKYQFDKSNFANDSFDKRNYENEIANEDKNNENLNFKEWVLIESKNIFTSKNEKKKNTYFFQSTNHRQLVLSNANNNSSKTLKIIDEKSKSNCFANKNLEINAKISIVKNAQNFLKKKKIVATVKRILKKKKFFKSSFWDIEKISKKLRLENVANDENLASRNWIKNVSSKKATFNASFLKFRIVLFILQQSDSFAQRIRFFVEKHRWSITKKAKTRNVLIRKKTTTSCWTIIARMLISIRRLNETSRTIYCAEKTNDTFFQNFSKKNFWNKIMMIRTLIISSTKEFSICWKKKYFWNNMNKNVKKYVDICSTCHRVKLVKHKSHDLL
jgi:hypothetical protein